MAENQVTVRFESNMNNNQASPTDPILLSGPVEIFAILDNITDVNGIAHPTKEELLEDPNYIENGKPVSLLSDYVANLAKEFSKENDKNLIIFVENVTNYPNNQDNRGAYYFLSGWSGKNNDIPEWKEILLGTHSHPNIERLNALERLSTDISKPLFLNPDGTITLGDIETKSISEQLKDLFPDDYKEKLAALEKFKHLSGENIPNEIHHLYANPVELMDTYDWTKETNIAVGTRREVYRRLRKLNKRLFLTFSNNEFDYIPEKMDENLVLKKPENAVCYLDCYAEIINFNIEKKIEDMVSVEVDKRFPNYIVFNIETPWINYDDTQIALFDNGIFIPLNKYTINKTANNLEIHMLKNYAISFEDLQRTLTIVSLNDSIMDDQLRDLFLDHLETDKLALNKITNELIKLYVQGEDERKPDLPNMYLTTNADGEICWSNMLLPTQSFKSESYKLTKEFKNAQENKPWYATSIRVVFTIGYKSEVCTPLLLIDNAFAFDANLSVDESNDLQTVFYIPKDKYIYESTDGTDENPETVTLIMIRSDVGNEISKEIAKNYLSREDAISILTRGKVQLDDYVKLTTLLNYSKTNHEHSQYALVGHNHDERYAMFHHTHPEILATIIKMTGSNVDISEIERWLEENLNGPYLKQLEAIISKIGLDKDENGEFLLFDKKVRLSDNIFTDLNELAIESDIAPLNENAKYLSDALSMIIKLFRKNKIHDSQVQLEYDLPVRLVNGPVGGLDKEKVYKKNNNDNNSTLQDILRDILNPFIDLDECRRLLTPTDAIFEWYIKDSTDEFQKVDPLNLPVRFIYEPLYFKMISLKNYKGEKCEVQTLSKITGEIYFEKTSGYVSNFISENGFYKYCNSLDEITEYPNIQIGYLIQETSNVIQDNYGIYSGLLYEKKENISDENILKKYDSNGNLTFEIPVNFILAKPTLYIAAVDELPPYLEVEHKFSDGVDLDENGWMDVLNNGMVFDVKDAYVENNFLAENMIDIELLKPEENEENKKVNIQLNIQNKKYILMFKNLDKIQNYHLSIKHKENNFVEELSFRNVFLDEPIDINGGRYLACFYDLLKPTKNILYDFGNIDNDIEYINNEILNLDLRLEYLMTYEGGLYNG